VDVKNILCRVVSKVGLAAYRDPGCLLNDTLFDVLRPGEFFVILNDCPPGRDRIMPILSPRYGKRWLYIHPASNAVNYFEVM
jgi:hypothetical protein